MKLAIVRQRYNAFGGAERFVERALEGLAATDLDVSLLTRQWSGEPKSRQTIVTCDPFYIGSTWRDHSFCKAVQAEIERGHYDLVQAHEKIPGCDVYRAGDGVHRQWLAQKARVSGQGRRFWDSINGYHRYTLRAEAAMMLHPKLRAVVCNSKMVQREIQHHFDLPLERLPLVYNGINTSVFNPGVKQHRERIRQAWGIPLDIPLFLFVGSGFERKGLAAAIKCLPKEAWLLVVGKDKNQPRYQHLAQQQGCADRVVFAGPQKDVPVFYGAADAFVFPTIYEPFGNVVLEAMACGLPVITTRYNGACEVIESGVNGFVMDDLNDESLRDQMFRLLDSHLRDYFSPQAALKASSFTVESMTNHLISLYQGWLGSGPTTQNRKLSA